ncbi:MAG TPA: hypothetical protein DEG43_07740 [Acidimicrobiaceae bacterium]|nr:hypothetical protein [Acidimicrobiaceae bacterium]
MGIQTLGYEVRTNASQSTVVGAFQYAFCRDFGFLVRTFRPSTKIRSWRFEVPSGGQVRGFDGIVARADSRTGWDIVLKAMGDNGVYRLIMLDENGHVAAPNRVTSALGGALVHGKKDFEAKLRENGASAEFSKVR